MVPDYSRRPPGEVIEVISPATAGQIYLSGSADARV